MKKILLSILLAGFILPEISSADTPSFEWEAVPDDNGYTESKLEGVTVDSSGNIYAVGYATGSGHSDAVFTKYSPTGQKENLLIEDINEKNDSADSVVLSGDGNNAYVTGYTSFAFDSVGDVSSGTWWDRNSSDLSTNTVYSLDDYIMARFHGAAIDVDENLYTSYWGYNLSNATFEAGILKYDISAGTISKNFTFNKTAVPLPFDIFLKEDYVYTTGQYYKDGSTEAFVSKHNITDLGKQWFETSSGLEISDDTGDSEMGMGVAADSDDNVYLSVMYVQSVGTEYYGKLVKLDSNGDKSSEFTIDTGDISAFGKIAITDADELYIGGIYNNNPHFFKYDTGLTEIYTHNITDDGVTATAGMFDAPADITIDGDGNIILAGAMDNKNMWLAKYSETSDSFTSHTEEVPYIDLNLEDVATVNSNNDSVATVSDQSTQERIEITSVSEGSAVITATSTAGNSATVEVEVAADGSISRTINPYEALGVNATNPEYNDTGVHINVDITVHFDRNIQEGTAGFNSISLKDNGTDVDFSTAVDNEVLTVSPDSLLDYDTTFTVTVPTGAVSDAQDMDVVMEETLSFNFTTLAEEDDERHMKLTDTDVDKAYFEGDDIEIEIYCPELSESSPAPSLAQQYIFTDTSTPVEVETVIDNPCISPIADHTFTVTGTIVKVSTPGVIGLEIDGNTEKFPVMDSDMYNEEDDSNYGLAVVGVEIPQGDVSAQPALEDFDNLYNTGDPITFAKEDEGSLQFPAGLNIIDNREELTDLHQGLNIYADADTGDFYVEVDPDSLTFLEDQSAEITLEGVDFSYFTIYVTNFGETANEDSKTDSKANNTASLSDGILSFDVDSFSRYSVLEDEEEKTDIDSDDDEYVRGGKDGYVNPDRGDKAQIHFKANEGGGYIDYTIYTLTGKEVYSGREYTGGGPDYIEWSGTNLRNNVVQPGVYIIHLEGPGVDTSIKIPVLR